MLTTAIILGGAEAPLAWLELAGLNVTGGNDAGLRYSGGYSQRGLVEIAYASNVVLSNCTVSLVRRSGPLWAPLCPRSYPCLYPSYL